MRTIGGGPNRLGHPFDAAVPPNGYAWWYLDALSSDGARGLTIIAMLGNVFSPYYALARRRGPAQPLNHCAMNVAIYEPRAKRWAMTERPNGDLHRTATELHIGRSSASWDGDCLTFSLHEMCVPIPSRIKGQVRVYPDRLFNVAFPLDPSGAHSWMPIAPRARIEVDLAEPDVRWTGEAYVDCNFGSEPLEASFDRWNWARAHTDAGTLIAYDTEMRDGRKQSIFRVFDTSGAISDVPAPPLRDLPVGSVWRVPRRARCDAGGILRIKKTLEDTPFYTRSIVASVIDGRSITMMHESLSLSRFSKPIVQAMLPFRMPRWAVRGRA
ncbi:MAG: carotenoid 1,2-hydratase [Hyphomicrobium sp.]|nr:MAG: carotenoid 1,2-hydratase [Hyphomicrobium sp.]